MASNDDIARPPLRKAYSFLWVTGALFVFTWLGQFVFQAIAFANQAAALGEQFTWSEYLPEFFGATLENWQSEFLQLCWQAVGLAFLFFWGSSQSRESDERLEAKIDRLLQQQGIDPGDITRRVHRAL